MFNLFKKETTTPDTQSKQQKKQEEVAKKSIQDLIPIKEIKDGVLITPDNKAVQIIKVSAINAELMSYLEVNNLLESYEGVLSSVDYHIQTLNLSMPIDLKSYISDQQATLDKTKNPFKQRLLKGYINHSIGIENSQDMIQRQHFLLFFEKIKSDNEKDKQDALIDLHEKKEHLIASMRELELVVEEATKLEIIRINHTLFDYVGSQHYPIERPEVTQVIEGGKLNA